ncbi:MAG: C40 family peptidase [Candidatus Omnitrophica bacterium]|nr:C40 family peptidase [Candidatus Omnitrophota bacterium]
MSARFCVLCAVCCVLMVSGCTARLYVVTVPVADLRARPVRAAASLDHDPLEETQLLYGERVRLHSTRIVDGVAWAFVEAIEQPEFTHHRRWEGYPGWVVAAALMPVSRHHEPDEAVRAMAALRSRSPADQRRGLVEAATRFIGTPYWWGGRSAERVDCSGLTNLSYRLNGFTIPRDAHEQWLRARPLSPSRAQAGDLVFLSEARDPRRIVHVMLYAGHDTVIEGPGTGQYVRRISVAERLGRPLETFRQGEGLPNGQHLFCGTYLP